MSMLDVPGARLYYETRGSGPPMLMVPGASGSADPFTRVAEHLAAGHTVIIYDRRGFSRSKLDEQQDFRRRLETDADDVARLIQHLGSGPVTVFGASSGAIVALEVLTRRLAHVHAVIAHEPPAVKLLDDRQQWLAFFNEMYNFYRESGIDLALEKFRERTFAASDWRAMAAATDPMKGEHVSRNARHWFEHELRQYAAVDLDLDALRSHADRIVLTIGREAPGYPCYRVNVELSKKLGCDLIELPGGHVGPLTHPSDFARELLRALPA